MRKPRSPERRKPSKPSNIQKPTTPKKQMQRSSVSPTKRGNNRTPQSAPSKRKTNNINQTSTADVSRRTRRFKSGAKALKEIKALQRTTSLLIPKACFCRLVKEVMNQFSYHQLRIQSKALQALQEAAEMYMVQFFEDSLLCTLHAKRVTLMVHDCYLMRRLRGPSEVANK